MPSFTLTVIQLPASGGIAEKQPGDIKIFPVPSSGVVQIRSDLPVEKLTVLNSSGIVIRELFVNSQVINLDMSSAGEGIYFLRLTGQNWVANRKVIIIQ